MKPFAISWRTGLWAAAGIQLLTSTTALATEITVWCWDMNFNGATMKEAAARYATAHPDVTLNIVDMAKADVEQKLQAQLASGTTEGLPDIVLIEDYGAQKYLQSFPDAFEPLNDKVDYSQFAPYKVALATLDDKTYSLPFDSGVTGFFYRSDLLEQAGYKEADLQDITWDKYIEIAKAVKEKTGHVMQGLDTSDSGAINILMQSAGSWYFNEDGTLNIKDNAAFKAALTQYQKIMMTPEIWKPISGWNEFTAAFTSGEAASVVTGVWITGTIKAAPDMAGKWGVAPIPKLDGVEGATHASNLGGSSWYVLSSSAEKDAATDFLATIWGKDVDFYQKILIDQGAFATYLPAREGPAFKASDDFFGGQPVWANFSTWLQAIPSVNYGVYVNEVNAAIAAQLPALAKGGSVDEAIAAIDAQVSQQIQ
ncbi:ABC transporter substrate-binding protein [Neotabrizicola shimadae]|uniref:Sugar ABC transporter substrate-binding protein n=1 Tax=Neotabrizicola shimadae TaxID=2807096 RepID=A0A8G1EAE3_9RHOB|nr:sugar ABC transporter substrate-binding protein [Neotabrizicola shimadae]QYZ68247.1 sugar ABC transporter substrate-binding protein [Neotabrizicola shimadae]